jgi:outer membrane protein assembly factor BamB
MTPAKRCVVVLVVVLAAIGSSAAAAVAPPPSPPDWITQLPGSGVSAPPAALGAAGRVIIAEGDSLFSLASPSGMLRWIHPFTSLVAASPVIVQDDVGATAIFASTFDGLVVRANDAGDVIWARNVLVHSCPGLPLTTAPTVALRRLFQNLVAPDFDMTLVAQPPGCDASGNPLATGILAAYRATDGMPVWSKVTKGPITGSPVVDAPGNRVYVSEHFSTFSFVAAYRLTDGLLLWQSSLQRSRNAPLLLGDHLYSLGENGMLTALDPAQGTVKWSLALSGAFLAPLVGRLVNNKLPYLSMFDATGRIVTVLDNGASGTLLWTAASGATTAVPVDIADVNPTEPTDPGPVLYVGAQDGSISEFALDKHTFGPNDVHPLFGCPNDTVIGGQLLATRQLPGTTAGVSGNAAWVLLHAPGPGVTSTKLAAASSSAAAMQIGVPWDCGTAGVGVATLRPQRQTVTHGRRFELALSWRHPVAWRKLAYLELRLRHGRQLVAWTILNQNGRRIRLWTGKSGRFTRAVRPGSAGVLRGGGAVLYVAHSSAGDNGHGGRVLRYRVTLQLRHTVSSGRYTVQALAADTNGTVAPFHRVGSVTLQPRTAR